MAGSLELVVEAVRTVHAPRDPQAQQQALKWLERFQNTVEAWNVALAALASPPPAGLAAEVRFFAAQTLKHKIVSDFSQLDEAMVQSLKETVWRMTVGGAANQRQVSAQLVLAVAALAVQCPRALWMHPVDDLLAHAQTHAADTDTVLAILACIPEQLANPLIHLSPSLYEVQKRQLIDANADRVTALITALLAAETGAARREALLACLLCWVRYGTASREIVGSVRLLECALGALAADLASDAVTLDTTAELLCELFFRLFQISDAPPEGYLATLLAGLAHLQPSLRELIRAEDSERTARLGQVFVEAGEAFLPWLVADAAAMHIVLESVLLLAESPDLKVVESTFPFWSALEGRLADARDADKEPFVPVYARLFRSLVLLHLAFPLDDAALTGEERDNFRDFRHVIGDCLKDCTRVIGSTGALLVVHGLFREISAANAPWPRIEAALFALRTISSSVDRRESEAMPEIARYLLTLASPPKVVYAVVLNIGCYAEWLRYHVEFLEPFLAYVTAALHDHPAAASMALKYLGQSCGRLMVAHEARLGALYAQSIGRLAPRDMLEVSEALANVLAAADRRELARLLPPYVSPWISLLASQPAASLDNLAVFVELVGAEDGEARARDGHPAIRQEVVGDVVVVAGGEASAMESLLQQLVPALPGLLARAGEEGVMESLTMLLKAIVTNHPRFSLGVADLLDRMYVELGVSGALYVMRHIVVGEPPVLAWPRLAASLAGAVRRASEHPDEMCDLLQLATAALDYFEEAVAEGALLAQILALNARVLAADPTTPGDLSAALLLLVHLLQRLASGSAPKDGAAPALDAAISSNMHALLQGFVQRYPLTTLSDLAAVLRRYHHYDPARSAALFPALVHSLPDTLFVPREKGVWVERYAHAVQAVRPRDLKDLLAAFVGACRRRL